MYAIVANNGKTYTGLTEQEFVSIRSILQYNRVPHQWFYTAI